MPNKIKKPAKKIELKVEPIEEKTEYATKSQFDDLSNLIKGLIIKVEETTTKEQPIININQDSIINKDKLSFDARKLIDAYLGEDFGFEVSYPYFRLFVPLEKSNGVKSYLSFYKRDVRTVVLKDGQGIDGIKAFIFRVRKNLKIK